MDVTCEVPRCAAPTVWMEYGPRHSWRLCRLTQTGLRCSTVPAKELSSEPATAEYEALQAGAAGL